MSRMLFILAIVVMVLDVPVVFIGRKGAGLIALNVSFWLFLVGALVYLAEARKNEDK